MASGSVAQVWEQWYNDFDAVEREMFTLAHTRSVWDVIWALRRAPGVYQDW